MDEDVITGIRLASAEQMFFYQIASNRYIVAVTTDDPADFSHAMMC